MGCLGFSSFGDSIDFPEGPALLLHLEGWGV